MRLLLLAFLRSADIHCVIYVKLIKWLEMSRQICRSTSICDWPSLYDLICAATAAGRLCGGIFCGRPTFNIVWDYRRRHRHRCCRHSHDFSFFFSSLYCLIEPLFLVAELDHKPWTDFLCIISYLDFVKETRIKGADPFERGGANLQILLYFHSCIYLIFIYWIITKKKKNS